MSNEIFASGFDSSGVTDIETKCGCSENFSTELSHPRLRSSVRRISVPLANRGGLIVSNKCLALLLVLIALPAFSAQHVAVHPRPSVESGDQETIREIIDMEHQAREASIRRDADFSQRTLAEDYVAITPLGQVTTKQDTVSARKSRQLRYDTIDISDMVVRVYGDTAVVTARADVKGHQLGEDFSGPYRYTRVWVRKTGKWQAVSYQATVTQ
jgi:ketosteroid isomerase-like protein